MRELARQIGQQATNVSYWERTGKPPRSEVLMDMARVLGVSVEEVLGLKAPRKAASPAGHLCPTFEAVANLPRVSCSKFWKWWTPWSTARDGPGPKPGRPVDRPIPHYPKLSQVGRSGPRVRNAKFRFPCRNQFAIRLIQR